MSELAQIAKLLRNHFPNDPELNVKYLKEICNKGGKVYTIQELEKVIAYLVLENNTDNIDIEDESPTVVKKGLFIAYMGAKKGHRRNGHVRMLVGMAKARSILDNRTLYTYAATFNTPSINLLTSSGFKTEKITKKWIYFSYRG